jgi:16S rRNA (adenine1518-N6/adenine1519-N6)-dimethyltransferase
MPGMISPGPPRLRRWGQNFLVDPAAAKRIVAAAEISPGESVLEIGPGDGALTRRIASAEARLLAVEIDPLRAAALLRELGGLERVQVVQGDILSRPIAAWLAAHGLEAPAVVIGNLPYNAATPILSRAVQEREAVSRIVATVQREVAERLTARAGGGAYGFLSVRAGLYADAEILFDLPPGAFRPRPRVTSSVVRIVPKPPAGGPEAAQRALAIASLGFRFRRKTLPNALASLGGRERWAAALAALGRPATTRAEELSPGDFVELGCGAAPLEAES